MTTSDAVLKYTRFSMWACVSLFLLSFAEKGFVNGAMGMIVFNVLWWIFLSLDFGILGWSSEFEKDVKVVVFVNVIISMTLVFGYVTTENGHPGVFALLAIIALSCIFRFQKKIAVGRSYSSKRALSTKGAISILMVQPNSLLFGVGVTGVGSLAAWIVLFGVVLSLSLCLLVKHGSAIKQFWRKAAV